MPDQVAPGRIVHFVPAEGLGHGECRPFLVLHPLDAQTVSGKLFTEGTYPTDQSAVPHRYLDENAASSWHWPDECTIEWPLRTADTPPTVDPPVEG